jgi:uracil-DNA glycosylase
VLLGQDPYHDDGQAHGLCFSVQGTVKPPPSLVNMFKELTTDIPGFKMPKHGNLVSWARQGVLLLNASLTVEAHKANSHSKCGWLAFTDDVLKMISASHPSRLVFLLWGGFAKKKASLIDGKKHVVIECAHPSPLSATHWFGCKTFSKCNKALEQLGKQTIELNLPENPGS